MKAHQPTNAHMYSDISLSFSKTRLMWWKFHYTFLFLYSNRNCREKSAIQHEKKEATLWEILPNEWILWVKREKCVKKRSHTEKKMCSDLKLCGACNLLHYLRASAPHDSSHSIHSFFPASDCNYFNRCSYGILMIFFFSLTVHRCK